MKYLEIIDGILLILIVTILYFLLRKFISWAIEYDDKWNKKHGYWGKDREEKKISKQLAYDRLTYGYFLIIVALLYLVIVD